MWLVGNLLQFSDRGYFFWIHANQMFVHPLKVRGGGAFVLVPFPGRSLNQRSGLLNFAIGRSRTPIMAEKLATQAWFVRIRTSETVPALIDFAVGKPSLQDAIAAILHHPRLDLGDEVTSSSKLSAIEISSYKLRPDEVRTYGRRVFSSGRWVVERVR